MPPPDGKYIASWMMLFIEILDTWIAGRKIFCWVWQEAIHTEIRVGLNIYIYMKVGQEPLYRDKRGRFDDDYQCRFVWPNLIQPLCRHFIGIHGFMANLYVGIL